MDTEICCADPYRTGGFISKAQQCLKLISIASKCGLMLS